VSRARERYFVGLMSGTSADGIDAVLTAVAGVGAEMHIRQVRHEFTPYDAALRERILAAASGEPISAVSLAELDRDIGVAFADAATALGKHARVARSKLAAVGSHGQTIAHAPPTKPGRIGATLQIGSAAIIAERTGLPVVADFRQGDIAAGGQGAPLVAWPDWVLFRHEAKTRVLVNLGGIANVTFLPAGGLAADTLAFDTGPGGMVIDALARRLFDKPCDTDGAIAAGAAADPRLLNELLAAPWFHRPPPKTTGREDWGPTFVERLCMRAEARDVSAADLLATASELTVQSIVAAIGRLTENPHEVILCGGGARNIYLAMRLRKLLVPASTISIERYDIDVTAKEAVSFAMLAAARIDRIAANVPQATGASRPVLLGSVVEV